MLSQSLPSGYHLLSSWGVGVHPFVYSADSLVYCYDLSQLTLENPNRLLTSTRLQNTSSRTTVRAPPSPFQDPVFESISIEGFPWDVTSSLWLCRCCPSGGYQPHTEPSHSKSLKIQRTLQKSWLKKKIEESNFSWLQVPSIGLCRKCQPSLVKLGEYFA